MGNERPYDPVRIVSELVRIPSPIFHELEASHYVSDFLEQQGFEVRTDELNNVIGTFDTGVPGPVILFCGHHDTVPAGQLSNWTRDPFAAEVADGFLYGRGASDDKGGLGTALAAVGNVLRSGRRIGGKILFAAVREETSDRSNRGIVRLIENGLTADFAIVTEPTSLNICLGHRGRVELEITTTGRTAHSSVPSLGINAIEHMASVITALKDMTLPSRPPLGEGSQNVGLISGGLQSNVVPDRCTIRVDRRIVAGESADTVCAEVGALLEQVKARVPDLSAEVRVLNTYLPSFMRDTDTWVRIASEAVSEVTGQFPLLYYMAAHTDQEWLVNDAGIPTIIFAPGDMDQAHTPDESISIEEIQTAERVYARLIEVVLDPEGTAKYA